MRKSSCPLNLITVSDVTLVLPDKIYAAEKPFGKARESTEPKRTVLSCKVSSTSEDFTGIILCHFALIPQFLHRVTAGYSGSDLTALARDAALGPIRGMSLLSCWSQSHAYFHNELNQFNVYMNFALHRVGTRPSP